jgi:hypothetical protein
LLCCGGQYGRGAIGLGARLATCGLARGSRLTFATSSFVSGLRLVSCADMVRAVIGSTKLYARAAVGVRSDDYADTAGEQAVSEEGGKVGCYKTLVV